MNDTQHASYTIVEVSPQGRRRSAKLRAPDRAAQPGDVYRVTFYFHTFAGVQYEPGDALEIIERTQDAPHNRHALQGNLRVKCKHFVSVWTCLEEMIAYQRVVLMDSNLLAPASTQDKT